MARKRKVRPCYSMYSVRKYGGHSTKSKSQYFANFYGQRKVFILITLKLHD